MLVVDWIVNSLYCDNVQYQSLLYTALFVQNGLSFCDKTVQVKLNHVIVCKFCMTVSFDVGFIMITYMKAVSCI